MTSIYYSFYEPCPTNQQYRTEHRLGHSLLSEGLAELYDIHIHPDTLADQLITGEHGKPILKDHPSIHFNISHCKYLVACCFDEGPVGVDAEAIRDFFPSILRRALSESEKAYFTECDPEDPKFQKLFYCIWTLKESWIKQSGLGLSQDLTESAFQLEDGSQGYEVSSNLKDLYFKNYHFEDGYSLSVCTVHPISDIQFHHR